ncbi:unnamed protein product [Thelazia callipaeda]|uniref:Tetraspanin n=1 Tax=Thelazia callipaeda TaxID=103827 RepID=A0A0N5CQA8_THECL|nr:unnamed protein product [Thelazia callipaeda]
MVIFTITRSLRDNCFYLTVYTSVLGCLVLTFFLLFALTGISGQVLFTAIKTAIDDTIIRYRDDPDLQLFVDWIQINLKCCGSRSPHDWNDNIYFSDAKTLHRYGSPEAGGVPFSCCKEDKSEILRNLYCGLGARIRPIDAEIGARGPYVRDNIYNQGCIEMLKQFLINNALYIVPGVTIFLLIQLFCVFLACILQNQILVQREEWYSTEHLKVFVYDA